MKTLLNLLASILFLMSCNTVKKVAGTYTTTDVSNYGIQLHLNADGSFSEFIQSGHCKSQWYFGFYSLNGKDVILKLVSKNLDHLGKQDTVIYNSTSIVKNRRIYLNYNGIYPLTKTAVYAQHNNFLGESDENGVISISSDISIDSLIIDTKVLGIRKLQIRPEKCNQLFVVIYDSVFQDCTDFLYRGEFKVSRKGLYSLGISSSELVQGKVFLRREIGK